MARSFLAPTAFIVLFLYTTSILTQTISVDAADSNLDLVPFRLSGSMTNDVTSQSGAGAFANGSLRGYSEAACIPFVLSLENTNDSAGNIVAQIQHDYSATGEAFTQLENITSLLPNPLLADDLNDFVYAGTQLSNGTTVGGALTVSVSGPVSNNNDSKRTYSITANGVPAQTTVQVVFCARLGVDASAANGASLDVRFSNGGAQPSGVNPNDVVQLPSLTITKIVSGGTAQPSDWSFTVTPGIDGISASSVVNIPANQSSVVLDNVRANGTQAFTVTEGAGPSGYAFSSGSGTNCVFSGATATATVTADFTGVNASCAFTNAQLTQPQLTIIKQVVNDNGGTAVAANFSFEVTANNPSSAFVSGSETGITITLDPGAYSVAEIANIGYSDSPSADCSGTIAYGEAKTCTITNNDIPGTLTVIKQVDNTAGGTMSSKDFLMTVTGSFPNSVQSTQSFEGSLFGTLVQMNAGAYSVDESLAVNYSGQKSADCSGTISNGEAKTCTITNTYAVPSPTQGTIIVQKHVVNDSGFGTKVAADFMLEVRDTHGAVIPVTGDEAGVSVLVDPGQYAVSEAIDPAYAQSFGAGCAGSIAVGETRICVVTNDDRPALLPTQDILPSVQCVAPTNHNTYIAYFGFNNTNQTAVYLPIGADNSVTGGGLQGNSYGQPEIFAAGASAAYPDAAFSVEFDGTPVTWALTVANDMTPATASSSSEACPTIEPARLHVFGIITNDNGGPTLNVYETASTLQSAGPNQTFENDNDGVWLTVNPGTYSLTSSDEAGYVVSYSPDCVGSIVQGETKICTVTYDDLPGENEDGFIRVTKVITNYTSEEVLVTDFVLNVRTSRIRRTSIRGTDVDSGVENAFAPETYQISETPAESQTFTAEDYTAVFSGDCSDAGVIVVESGQHYSCTITNTFGTAPTSGGGGGGNGGGGGGGGGGMTRTTGVTVITNVINNNGGSLLAPSFEAHVNGEDPALTSTFNMSAISTISFAGNTGGVNVALSAGSYTVTQTNSSGYAVTMSAGCSGTLITGQVATCIITNDDLAAAAVTPVPIPAPTPLVLGDTDTADNAVVLPTPTPEVLGATDEELPRTGFPVGMLVVWIGGAAYVASRASKKQ